MTQTHIISWTAGAGQAMSISLEQKDATLGTALFPVSGLSRLRWSLSEFGFGGLNQEITLNIVDDADNTFFDMFDNNKRQDTRIVIKSGAIILFVGYVDYEQISTFPYKDGIKEIAVKFYNPVSYKQNISLDIANLIRPFRPVAETLARTGYLRVHQLFRSMFHEYGEDIAYSHRWKQHMEASAPRYSGYQFGDNAYVMLNQLWIHRRTFGVPSGNQTPFIQILNDISRAFWFRYGWSITHQKPLIIQMDTGRVTDPAGAYPYIVISLKPDAISSGGSATPSANETSVTEAQIRDTDNTSFYSFLPELDENKLTRHKSDPAKKYIMPYCYIQVDNPASTKFLENPGGVAILADRYEQDIIFDETQFDPVAVPADNDKAIFIVRDEDEASIPPDPQLEQGAPVKFSDPHFDTYTTEFITRKLRQSHVHRSPYTDEPKELSTLNAELHMLIRKDVQRKYRFDYMGYLDPMLNYLHDGKIITLYQGDYDLITGETRVEKSMSIFDQTE